MKILFLDDSHQRHAVICTYLKDIWDVFNWAETSSAAINYLKQNDYDIVLLDHDLGDPKDKINNGRVVVDYMIKNDIHPSVVVVHSWNSPRAREMTQTLQMAGVNVTRYPFSNEMCKMIKNATKRISNETKL